MSLPPRLPGFTYLGPSRYFLTLCTHRRNRAFLVPETVRRALLEILRAARDHRFLVLAYCFMPDHLHALVEGTANNSDLRAFVKLARMRSAQAYADGHGRRLWQKGYHDRVLRRGDDARAVARYILENPVRAGLVLTPTQYPYLGSAIWTVRELLDGTSR